MPRCTAVPELGYPDVNAAAEWLCLAFGFDVRLRIGNHRIQLHVGDGAVVLHAAEKPARASVMVRFTLFAGRFWGSRRTPRGTHG